MRHGIAVDDFGTGFSHLASLAALPANTLKIDRSLVTGVDQGEKVGALLGIAVQLGRTLGFTTVAEGVETTEQYRRVSDLGCDLVQGYFTGRPVSTADFEHLYLRTAGRNPEGSVRKAFPNHSESSLCGDGIIG